MLSQRRRLRRLERSPLVQPRADPLIGLALQQISDAELELLIGVARDEEVGVCRELLPDEAAAVASYETALEGQRL